MKTLSVEQFDDFFEGVHGYRPFSWQSVLAARVCRGEWPRYVKAPTASGKTALVDIAVFAMAYQAELPPRERTAPRRVFFVVDRRIVVDETFRRSCKIAKKLGEATDDQPVLHEIALRLRHIAGESAGFPLDSVQLRGGVYRDDRWVRSATQPTIVASTVDQVGSRLLFRGYGVSESARPIHAALAGNDSLIVLDEAHLSQPFSETLRSVQRFRQKDWAEHPVQTPFRFVEMTATPPSGTGESVFSIDDPEVLDLRAREPARDEKLRQRHGVSKPTRLVLTDRTKGKTQDTALVEKLVEQAEAVAESQPRAIAVVVNRVATARRVHALLFQKYGKRVDLMIGRMRPIDRDDLAERLCVTLATGADRRSLTESTFVVATQCLEVGADLDFDALVTECASIDALRQRFGRLNRDGRDTLARGAVVFRSDNVLTAEQLDKLDADAATQDPIYGNAMARTWNWLNEIANDGIVDFGVDAMTARFSKLAERAPSLQVGQEHAPVLFPAYLDRLAQTSPAPRPDVDISLFLHGPNRNDPEVQVCWRADLSGPRENWDQIIGLLPPTSTECMSVPIALMRRWLLVGAVADDDSADVPCMVHGDKESTADATPRWALAWRGVRKSKLVHGIDDLQPGDTLVLPVEAGGWSLFGYIPHAPLDPSEAPDAERDYAQLAEVDRAEQCFVKAQDKAVVRLHAAICQGWPDNDAANQLLRYARVLTDGKDDEFELPQEQFRELLREVHQEINGRMTAGNVLSLTKSVAVDIEPYPDGHGVVITSRRRLRSDQARNLDDGNDALCKTERDEPVPLSEHLQHVRESLNEMLLQIPLVDGVDQLRLSADLHDWGKADERFQAMLINGDVTDVAWQPQLWAKSSKLVNTRQVRQRSGLPPGFRHELLSVALAESSGGLPCDAIAKDLVLHLIATHHGYCRPFAPVVHDEDPPAVDLGGIGLDIGLKAEQRRASQPYSLNSGNVNRFHRVLRRYGWWGLAYLESVLRLSDQRASAREDAATNRERPHVQEVPR